MDELRDAWDRAGQPWRTRMRTSVGSTVLDATDGVLLLCTHPELTSSLGLFGSTLPDLSDGATRGALLDWVREVTGDPRAAAWPERKDGVWGFTLMRSHPIANAMVSTEAWHEDEGMAILLAGVDALEAKPARKPERDSTYWGDGPFVINRREAQRGGPDEPLLNAGPLPLPRVD